MLEAPRASSVTESEPKFASLKERADAVLAEAAKQDIDALPAYRASLLLDVRPVTFRALQGWVTTLPLGIDGLRLRRTFDTKAINLQRTGKLGTYASCLGHEATHVGVGAAMRADDVLVPVYREYGTQFWRGVKNVRRAAVLGRR